MDDFAKGKPAERQPYFEETAARRNSTTTAVEKDFWICWTLKHLFTLKTIPELRFKGGTSLSKVFGLIDRFSEDIDISIDRAALGFSGERDMANPALSGTKRKALDEELRAAITTEVNSDILPKLHERFHGILGKHGWGLALSKDEKEEMTLLFHYPNAFEYSKYLQPQIKIEFGRGDQQPSDKSSVTPFVAEMFPDIFREKLATVLVLDSERTFWEKVTLLHAENHRPDPTKLKPRMARHWSDIAVMSTAERFKEDKLSIDLLRQVVRFKNIYFAANWANYDTAIPGTLRIVPDEPLQTILRKDYQQMEEMFPSTPLTFDEILARLETLQQRINARETK
jgi:nucleotidyltransferase AbiEii toxin of type IV toxin-antitoxin system